MKVTLKPLSHPAMGEIVIVDPLFAIGRQEAPFASQPAGTATKLSKRHARIFQEKGNVYIADLGSLNGTVVNNQQLKSDAVVLKSNDLVSFGGEFKFQIQLDEAAPKPSALPLAPIRLMLLPVSSDGQVEPLVIEQFPFLIARVDTVFAGYQDRFPEELRKISRRHAVITRKGDDIWIEDLDSSNGTFVTGERLDERAKQLTNDDTVAFGGERFNYRVVIERTAPALSESEIARTLLKPIETQLTGSNKTRFVSQANSFLDVFCAEDRPITDAQNPDIAATAAVKALQIPTTPLQKLQAILAQMWNALVGKAGLDRRVVASVVGAVGLIVVAATVSWLLGGGKREIKSALDAGDYARSAMLASEYLQDKPDDYEAEAWGETALAKAVVPPWSALLEARKFDTALQLIAAQKKEHGSVKRGQAMLDLLNWTTRVEAHIAARGGQTAPVVMFRDEDTIRSLVDEWDADSFRRQQLIGQIASYEPAFEPIHASVFSNLRSLRNDNAIYVKAIDQLKADVTRQLATGDRAGLNTTISEFSGNYPHVQGVALIKSDLAKLDSLTQQLEQRHLADLVQMQQTVKFQTPMFAQHAQQWFANSLPPPDVVQGFRQAADAWTRGEHDKAIQALTPLTNGSWGDVATRQIERYRTVATQYDALQAARGSKGYWDRLVEFSAMLIPAEDEHLTAAIEPDLLAHRGELTAGLDASLNRAQSLWSAYQNANGIPGVVRVEERITDKFRLQAQRLSDAHAQIVRGNRTYQLLKLQPPATWTTLSADVISEVKRQRRWLQDLNIILSPALLQAKLNLLPQLSSESTP